MLLQVNNKEVKMRAAQLQQMWKTFFHQQLLLFQARVHLLEFQRHSSVAECISRQVSSKCLNDSSRAMKVKLEAATLLATGGLSKGWSCVLTTQAKPSLFRVVE